MGALTLAGIIIGAIGAGVSSVGGILIGVDVFQKTAKKTCEDWREAAEENLKKQQEEQQKE